MRIHVVGDSISIQYGPYLEQHLAGFMEYSRKSGEAEALLNLDNPMGANGGDSSRVLAYLRAMRDQGGVDAGLLVVNCGLHDIRTDPASGRCQVGIEAYADNLRAIVYTVRDMQLPLVWVRTTPCDEKVHNKKGSTVYRYAADCQAYNEAADEVMHSFGVPAIDLFRFTRNLGEDLYCDHVHFHESIREKQGAFIAGWLIAYATRLEGIAPK